MNVKFSERAPKLRFKEILQSNEIQSACCCFTERIYMIFECGLVTMD